MKHIPLALLLLATPAAADTFNVSGQFDSFAGTIYPFDAQTPIDMSQFLLPRTVIGSLTFTDGALSALNIVVSPEGGVFDGLGSALCPVCLGFTTSGSFTDAQNWSAAVHFKGVGRNVYQLDLTLTDMAGLLTATLFEGAQPGIRAFDAYVGNFTNWHGSVVQTPLPMTLPLFATGLAGLGWLLRRKKC